MKRTAAERFRATSVDGLLLVERLTAVASPLGSSRSPPHCYPGSLIVPPFALYAKVLHLHARKRRFGLFIASIINIFVF